MRSPFTGAWRSALLVVAVVGAAAESPLAQRLACSTIRRGETAALVAARITGRAESRHEPWFHIVDPRARRIVAKAEYDRIQAGWRACIAPGTARPVPARGDRSPVAVDRVARAGVAMGAILGRTESVSVLFAALVLLLGLATRTIDEYMKGRQAVLGYMKRFGERFVQEFERPLVPSRPRERVIDSRLRCSPFRGRVDVLLAPRDGHLYPNLADHKRNVEYDVTRVLQVLKSHPFVHGPLFAQGRWVVVPFQLKLNARQAGEK